MSEASRTGVDPEMLQRASDDITRWTNRLASIIGESATLRVLVAAQGSADAEEPDHPDLAAVATARKLSNVCAEIVAA